MSCWQTFLKADPIPWLLEPENPSVRYFTLTEILDRPSDDNEVKSAAWRFMLSAEFGVDGSLPQIRKIADYLLKHAQLENGGFCSVDVSRRQPGIDGTPCFTGNIVWSFIRLGYLHDPHVQKGIDWLVKYSRFDNGEATSWPAWLPQDPNDFCWGRHTCFRGVIAHLQALAEIPVEKRSTGSSNIFSRKRSLKASCPSRSIQKANPASGLHCVPLQP